METLECQIVEKLAFLILSWYVLLVWWGKVDDKLTGFDWSEKKRKELTWPLSNLVCAVLAECVEHMLERVWQCVVVSAFQITFRVKIYFNDIFLFFKKYF